MLALGALLFTLALQGVSAFPSILEEREPQQVTKSTCGASKKCDQRLDIPDSVLELGGKNAAAQKISANRDNCGFLTGPCPDFDAEKQYVSNKGKYAYKAPTLSQVRGPCPGLNAAANHGYLPRDGVATIVQTIAGLGKMYSMSIDLAGFLAAYAVGIDGDVITRTWSIGGPSPKQSNLGGLLRTPQGISYSHNKYEGDSSISRCDAFINEGDGHSLSVTRFKYAYESKNKHGLYTLDGFSRAFTKNAARSEKQNPLYFAPLFSTTLVSPAAYNFVINMMSNHSAESPAGYLNGHIFKEFFGIEGEYPNFKWKPGQERMPDNWYRRPRAHPYTASGGVFGDLASEFAAYPNSFRFGGNVNGPNTYTGIDISDFTGGVFNAKSLLKGDNLACFFYQNLQQGLPDQLQGGLNDVTKATKLINRFAGKAFGHLTCPQVEKFNNNVFTKYSGHNYSPKPGKGVPTTC